MVDESLLVSEDQLNQLLPEDGGKFEQLQWEYLAYRIRKWQYNVKISDPVILPYTKQKRIGGGGSSTVYKVDIHPAHQNLVKRDSNDVG